MQFDKFKSLIPKLKQATLGGVSSQLMLAPSYRKQYDFTKLKATNLNTAAVLIVFFPNRQNETCFILTKRADYNGHHAKQISFPGGKKNSTDSNLLATAIRETKEEIGIQVKENQIIKNLTEVYILPSNFLVNPYVAILDKTPEFTLNYEVESILHPRLSQLLDNKTIQTMQVETADKKKIKTPCFIFDNEIIWGATAMMLSELRQLIIYSL